MAASGFTPILIYASGTASNVPLAANLTSSASGAELALNYADGKLYFKNSSGVVTLLAGAGGAGVVAGSNTQIQFNNSGVFGASANLTWSGTVLSTTGLTATGAITLNTTTNNQSYTTTGAGTITISSGTAGSINNMNIGATTAGTGTFTNLTYTGTLTGSTGVIAIGTNQIYKDSSGNVGIGTSSPGVKLDVSGVIRSTGTSAILAFSKRSTGTGDAWGMYSQSGEYNIYDYTAGVSRLVIDTSGNVGIGQTSPQAKLQINTAADGAQIIVVGAQTANEQTLLFRNSYYTNNATGGIAAIGWIDSGSSGGSLTFKTGTNGGGVTNIPSEKMRIDQAGNVGIGTSSPAGKLEVSGGRSWFTANSELYSVAFRYSSSTGVMYMGATNSVSTPSIQFSNSGGTALATIDYSGNVGIGTSSPVYRLSVVGPNNTGIASFSGNNNGVIPGSDGDATLVIGGNYAAGSAEVDYFHNNSTFKGTIGGHRFLQRTGASTTRDLMWLTENQTTFYTAGTERMRINSSGQVGIGTSAPTGQLDVRTAAGVVAQSNLYTGSNAAVVKFNIGQVGTIDWDIGLTATNGHFYIGGLGGSMAEAYKIVRTGTNIDYQTWNTNSAERMRITSGGSLLVGTTTGTVSPAVGCQLLTGGLGQISIGHDTSAVSGNYYASFAYNSGVIGSITQSGTTAVLYNTTSDQRLKENIQDAESASTLIDSLQVRQFNWKSDNTHQRYGFVAQELVTVAPEAVHQPVNEEEMMAVDYSKLVPMLVKEIQSLRKRLADAGIA